MPKCLPNQPDPLKPRYSTFVPEALLMAIDRDSLIEDYVQQIIEGMDYKTMERMIYDTLKENLSSYSDEELVTEVEEYNPELLES